MSVAPLEISLSEPSLVVVPWTDDVVDSVGFDARSQYVELFWLNVLGPPMAQYDTEALYDRESEEPTCSAAVRGRRSPTPGGHLRPHLARSLERR